MLSENKNIESKALLVTDHISAMLAYWDKNQICRFANVAYREWFGKTPEEMVGKITIKELLGPIYPQNEPYILGALEGKPQTFEREIPIPGGGLRYSIANYFPDILNEEVRGFFVHVADITDLKLLEKELAKSNETIVDQNKRLLNFANIVSHNLKSYAGNLKSILDLLLKSESDDEKKILFNYLQRISKGLSSTVSHLTQIAEVENKPKLILEEINVYAFVEHTIDVLRLEIDSTHSIIHNNVGRNVTVSVNPTYMESILLNLLTNTIKYKHPDRNLNVEIDSVFKDHELQIVVKDNGSGINLEKHRDEIFGLHKTFHGNADAKGVGLFIAKLQIEAMSGRIELISRENEGTSFIIHLPTRDN